MGAACCGGAGAINSEAPIYISLPVTAFQFAPYLTAVVVAPILLVLLSLYPLLVVLSPVSEPPQASEVNYASPSSDRLQPLPSLRDEASVQLSVVIPAFNESSRLPKMLDEAITYLEQLRNRSLPLNQAASPSKQDQAVGVSSFEKDDQRGPPTLDALDGPLKTFEVIIVDDGSTDDTSKVALEYADSRRSEGGSEIRVVRLAKNKGKGAAVRHGVLHCRGSLILFADADGATRFSDIAALCREMKRILTPSGHGIAVGSRAHLVSTEAVVKRSFIRNFLMHSFHIFLSLLLRPPVPLSHVSRIIRPFLGSNVPDGAKVESLSKQPLIRDTQCGFKLFTRESARSIFPLSHIDRWIFDVELLLLAEMASEAASASVWSIRNGSCSADSDRAGQEGSRRPSLKDPLLDLPLPIAEVPVHWEEIGGSKIDLVKDSVGMALDLLIIRANYALGRWKKPAPVRL
ncbi:hypothetical protein IE53DRAFT_312444 [Violaceomyces palustris]|uniref:Uncharacterized protein n=1 Tax=Violaceomyces palustris TaxID=1673888 RepID=A0ACD0P2D1_9BASI|nr:hypothetical protein IE53DRAFT_312444 [Violaceomyces palustris]